MAEADAAAIAAGTPGLVLMERAGAAVADAVCARYPRQAATVLCGPGNNGGDGYVAARLLADRGWPVEVRRLGEPATQDAQAASARWTGATAPLNGALPPGVWIDALFGAGLSRPLAGPAAAAAVRMAEALTRVVAVDVAQRRPGDTGEPIGPAARAAITVTFHAKKPAHVGARPQPLRRGGGGRLGIAGPQKARDGGERPDSGCGAFPGPGPPPTSTPAAG